MICFVGRPSRRPTFHLPGSLISSLLHFQLPACFVSPYPLHLLRHDLGPFHDILAHPNIGSKRYHPLGDMLDRLIAQMSRAEGVTEELNARNQMEWVRQMNNVRHRAEEIVMGELICR